MTYSVDVGDSVVVDGHRITIRERYKACGRGCRGCPHVALVIEDRMPSGRRRELWAEPPTSSGRAGGRQGRTRRTDVRERIRR